MRIVIAGGSGFLGRALTAALAAERHDVVVLSRSGRGAGASTVSWNPNGDIGSWSPSVDGAAVVVNLAGESIAGARWSAAQKQRILDSRVNATRSLVKAIGAAAAPPTLFVSGSAVGYYGPRGDEPVTEETAAGADFLAGVCVQWEAEARRAATPRTRVVCIRTGLVLSKQGGALPQILLPFKFGAGGPVGSGRQYWPWIHLEDWVRMVRWTIDTPSVTDAVNVTAPNPVTNREFARALGRAMRRPAFMPAPTFALKLILGEMAEGLLLSGQRALPAKATRAGFSFKYSDLDNALNGLLAKS